MITEPEEKKRLLEFKYNNRFLEEFRGIDLLVYQDDPFFFDLETQVFKHFFVNCIERGASFGELGVMRNVPRAATVVAKETSLFGTLESEDFVKIMKPEE